MLEIEPLPADPAIVEADDNIEIIEEDNDDLEFED